MSIRPVRDELTEREREQNEHDLKVMELQSLYNLKIAELDKEVQSLSAKWASWTLIPRDLILLPVRLLFGVAFIFSVFTKKEMPTEFWKFVIGREV